MEALFIKSACMALPLHPLVAGLFFGSAVAIYQLHVEETESSPCADKKHPVSHVGDQLPRAENRILYSHRRFVYNLETDRRLSENILSTRLHDRP